MAVRDNGIHSERVKQRIQTTQLVKRLQDDALGKIELTDGQRKSAIFLLSKTLADPAREMHIEHSGSIQWQNEIAAARARSISSESTATH
jgi:hypothetical protein